MSEITKGKWIVMQEDLGLGHKGNILVTTNVLIEKNLPPIATEINSKANAQAISAVPELIEVCEKLKRYDKAAKEGRLKCEEGHEYWMSLIDDAEAALAKAGKAVA